MAREQTEQEDRREFIHDQDLACIECLRTHQVQDVVYLEYVSQDADDTWHLQCGHCQHLYTATVILREANAVPGVQDTITLIWQGTWIG